MFKIILIFMTLVIANHTYAKTEKEAYEAWNLLINKGGVEFNNGNSQNAIKFFKLALEEIYEFGPTPALASTYSAQASVARAEGDLDEASRLFTNAVAMYQKSGAPVKDEVLSDLYSLSAVELDLKNYKKSEEYILMAFQLASKLNSKPNQLTIDIIELYKKILTVQSRDKEAGEIAKLLEDYRQK